MTPDYPRSRFVYRDNISAHRLRNTENKLVDGFGGKRALGVLRKSELCLNRSKLRMQFCLGAFNNVLYVFLLKFASFSKRSKILYLLSRQHVTAKMLISG